MTKARELIEQLQRVDPESEVGVYADTGGFVFAHVSLAAFNPHENGSELYVRERHHIKDRVPIYIIS